MYKDKGKQREAVREAGRVLREKRKGITDKVIYLENGSYIHINKLVDPKWRSLLIYLSEHLRYPEGLRVGIQGPTIGECKKLLEVTEVD